MDLGARGTRLLPGLWRFLPFRVYSFWSGLSGTGRRDWDGTQIVFGRTLAGGEDPRRSLLVVGILFH